MTHCARDVIEAALTQKGVVGVLRADYVIARLTAAGCRILGPDEVDGPTVEKCAEVAVGYGTLPGFPDGKTGAFRKHRHAIAAAIRSLGDGR